MEAGIIGYGNFGKVMKKAMEKAGMEVKVYSRGADVDEKTFFPLEDVCSTDYLFPCVPISVFKDVLIQINGLIGSKTVVADVCSVKVLPSQWMMEVLGEGRALIATHPMFGPESTNWGERFEGLRMMMDNISAPEEKYLELKERVKGVGIAVVEMTADEHDRAVANTLLYSQILGRLGEAMGIEETPIDTVDFKLIYQAMGYVTIDSRQLFEDMNFYNPYAKEMRDKLLDKLGDICKRMDNL